MKSKKLNYLLLIIGIASLISALISKNRTITIILIAIFAISFSFSYVELMHNKMLDEDKNYKISVSDERSQLIRDKVNASMGHIFMYLNFLIAIIALINKENIAATLLILSNGCSPLIMHFINKHYEKKY